MFVKYLLSSQFSDGQVAFWLTCPIYQVTEESILSPSAHVYDRPYNAFIQFFHIPAIFHYCCPDCQCCPIHLNNIGWAIWAAIEKYSFFSQNKLLYHKFTAWPRCYNALSLGNLSKLLTLRKKATINQITTMLATSRNRLFPGHNHRY